MTNIIVFGSNLAGRHSAGAASYAHKHYGAEYGVGIRVAFDDSLPLGEVLVTGDVL